LLLGDVSVTTSTKKMGGPCGAAHCSDRKKVLADQVIALATLVSTFDTLPPTVPMAAIAATEISEAISTYSMAVAPFSFFIRRRKMDSMGISPGIKIECGINLAIQLG